jgi:hypothetical protein
MSVNVAVVKAFDKWQKPDLWNTEASEPLMNNCRQSGLGCMVFNHGYGQPDILGSVATMNRAIELGDQFLGHSGYLCQW